MSQPQPYTILTSFASDEANAVSGRSTVKTTALDTELANIQVSVNKLVTNIGLIQRDDGVLMDRSVSVVSLSTAVLALIGSAGFTVSNPLGWLTATSYPARAVVTNGTGTYVSAVAHVSGVFATDLAAGKWATIFNTAVFTAANITFTPTGTVAATNVQAAIAEVASEAADAANVNWLPSGTGAVSATVAAVLARKVWAPSFGFLPTATAAANKAALVAAIAYLATTGRGGDIGIPAGVYNCDPGIAPLADNITFSYDGIAQQYGLSSAAPCSIKFTAGAIGFDFTFIDAASAGSYCGLRGIEINGNGVLATGVKANGLVTLDSVNITGCTAKAFWLYDFINMTTLRDCSAVSNAGAYGLFIGGGTGANTILSVDGFLSRSNGVGIRIENAKGVYFTGQTVSENNTGAGLEIYKPTGGTLQGITFENIWLESNCAGTSNYQATIDSQTKNLTTGGAFFLTFNQFNVHGTGTVRALNILCVREMTVHFFTTDGGDVANAVLLGTNAYNVVFARQDSAVGGGTITDGGLMNYVWNAKKTQIAGDLTGGPQFPTVYTGQLNLTNAVASGDANTIDKYQEKANAAVALGITGCTTTPAVNVDYTIIGDTVVLTIPNVTALTSNAVTKTLTGLTAEAVPVTAKNFISAAVDNGGAYAACRMVIEAGTGVISIYKDPNGGAFTAAGAFAFLGGSFAYRLK